MTWHPLVPSEEVPPGRVTDADVGDVELVVWRDILGRPCVMEARCPHLWSHLAFEGVVDGDELVCAAHFWRFDRSGRGTKVGGTGRRDEKTGIRVYEVKEEDGRVWAELPD
jgi:phenylpropionate dioxygenase-like ring-hydroxylating dioxygenase large terminal subunit